MITLEYNGTEQSLADWGFALAGATIEHVSLAPSRLVLDLPGASLSAAPAIPFRGKVILRVKRTFTTSFEGGYVAFIGYRTRCRRYTTAQDRGVTYAFENAWHFLGNLPYQQRYASYNTVGEVLEYKPVSELLLFTELDGADVLQAIDAGEQIENILQYVIDVFAAQGMAQPFIIGTVDADIPFPSYQAREMLCAAAILKCLELSPDITCWFDYSTAISSTPTPTIHFRKRANLTARSLAIENGTDHESLEIVPREDLVPRSVVLTYKVSNSVDGNVWVLYLVDKYGPNGQSHASDPVEGLDVLIQTIELQGYSQNSVYGSLAVEAVDANAGTQAARKTWWSKFFPEFVGNKLRNVVFGTATIKDKAGGTVSLATYPNRLLPESGTLLPWMEMSSTPVEGVWVNIEVEVAYNEYDVEGTGGSPWSATNGNIVNKHTTAKPRKLKATAVVTNGSSGAYSSLGSFVAGETVPGFTGFDGSGVAQFTDGIASRVYTALATLQYEGRDVRVQDEPSSATADGPLIGLQHKLNLTGGATAWETMNAQVQTVTEDLGSGRTHVTFGPARHINAGDWAAMFQFNRLRRVWQNPALRETADLGTSSGSIQMPEKVPAENSAAGLSAAEYQALVGATFSE